MCRDAAYGQVNRQRRIERRVVKIEQDTLRSRRKGQKACQNCQNLSFHISHLFASVYATLRGRKWTSHGCTSRKNRGPLVVRTVA